MSDLTQEQLDGARVFILRRALMVAGMDPGPADAAAEKHASRVTFDRSGVDVLAFDALVEEIRASHKDRSQADGWSDLRRGIERERESADNANRPALNASDRLRRLRGEKPGKEKTR